MIKTIPRNDFIEQLIETVDLIHHVKRPLNSLPQGPPAKIAPTRELLGRQFCEE